jgi:hypothetical protein
MSALLSSVSITRTADTNAYTAGDVIGAATGSTAAVEFVNIGQPSGDRDILITSAELEIDASAIPSGMTSFNLYLYSATPPGALGDNAAFDLSSGDRASFLGKISLGNAGGRRLDALRLGRWDQQAHPRREPQPVRLSRDGRRLHARVRHRAQDHPARAALLMTPALRRAGFQR